MEPSFNLYSIIKHGLGYMKAPECRVGDERRRIVHVKAGEEEVENRTGKDDDFTLRNMETKGRSQDSESVTIGVHGIVVRVCLLLENSRDR